MIPEALTTVALAGMFYMILRRVNIRSGRPAELAEPAVEKGEWSVTDLFAEGEVLLKSERFEEAAAKFLAVERQQPNYPKLANRLGIIYLEKGEYEKAVKAFEKAVREDPTKAVRHVNLAMAYKAVGKDAFAKRSLEQAINLAPENDKYKYLLAEIEGK